MPTLIIFCGLTSCMSNNFCSAGELTWSNSWMRVLSKLLTTWLLLKIMEDKEGNFFGALSERVKLLLSSTQRTKGELTSVAHVNAVVHCVAEHGHDDAEQGEEHPVLADFRERVPPRERHRSQETWRPLASVRVQLLAPQFLLFLALLLQLAQLGRLLTRVLAQAPAVAAVHLSITRIAIHL